MQRTDPVGIPAGQPGAQRVREEVVVAIPPPLVVERDDEQFPRSSVSSIWLTVGATGQGVAEAPVI